MSSESYNNNRPAFLKPKEFMPQQGGNYWMIAPEDESKYGFKFSGVDSVGHAISSYVSTQNPVIARQELERAGIRLTSLSPYRPIWMVWRREKNKLPSKTELATFAEQFGDMFEAGEKASLICSLIAKTHQNKLFARALLNVSDRMSEGYTMADSFAGQYDEKGRPVFPITFCHAIKIGEDIGGAKDLDTDKSVSTITLMLQNFAADTKKAQQLFSDIFGALMYPAGLGIVTIVMLAVMMIFVIPQMKMIYESLSSKDSKLPWITQILIDVSDFCVSYPGLAFFAVLIVGAVLFYRWIKTPAGSEKIARWSLKLPFPFHSFSELLIQHNAAMLLRNMSMLSAGGSDLPTRFKEAAATTENPEFKEMLLNILQKLYVDKLSLSEIFAPYERLMGIEFKTVLITYEKQGDMQRQFHNYAKVLEQRAERKVKIIVHVFQNYSIIPIAAVIGFIVIALYAPMFELIGRMSGK